MKRIQATFILALLVFAATASADPVTVQMNALTEQGIAMSIGTVALADTAEGLRLTPALTGLAPGLHGFHVHDRPDCGPGMKDGKAVAGLAAGGHYDPAMTGKHEGPAGKGHLGDLPALAVGEDGTAMTPVVAPRLKVADVLGRSLMVHGGGDNFGDVPAPLGGGGARVACGVIK